MENKEIKRNDDILKSDEFKNISNCYEKLLNIDTRIFRNQDKRVISIALEHLELIIEFYNKK